jgi:hypothetical protein
MDINEVKNMKIFKRFKSYMLIALSAILIFLYQVFIFTESGRTSRIVRYDNSADNVYFKSGINNKHLYKFALNARQYYADNYIKQGFIYVY